MDVNISHIDNKGHGPPPSGLEFVVIRTALRRFQLTRREAVRLMARLDRWWVPRWVEFVDLHGALVRLRTSDIREVFDTSPSTRDSESVLVHALEREERATTQRLEASDNE